MRRLLSVPDVRVIALTRRECEPSAATIVKCPLERLTADTWRAAGVDTFETVFHLAGFTPKSTAQANSLDDIYHSTIAGTYSLIESLPSAPGKFVYVSSVDVYGTLAGVTTEESPVRPSEFHGAAKVLCEAMIGTAATNLGFRKVVLRYGHLYGPGEEAYEKAIPVFIRAVLAGKKPSLSPDANTSLRDFLFIDDAVEAAIRAASYAGVIEGPINVVHGESVSIRGIAELIFDLAGEPLDCDARREPGLLGPRVFDPRRMKELLGSWPLVSLREGLAREFAHVKAMG